MKPQSLLKAVQAGNEYVQIRMNPNPGVTIRQVDEEEKEGNSESVQVA